jgi:hypothetical protein
MSVAARYPRQRELPAAEAFSLVTGSLRFDLIVEGSHWPVVPVSVRLNEHLWGGCRSRGRWTGPAGHANTVARLHRTVPGSVLGLSQGLAARPRRSGLS